MRLDMQKINGGSTSILLTGLENDLQPSKVTICQNPNAAALFFLEEQIRKWKYDTSKSIEADWLVDNSDMHAYGVKVCVFGDEMRWSSMVRDNVDGTKISWRAGWAD